MTTTPPEFVDVIRPHVVEYYEQLGLFDPPSGNKRKISASTISPIVSSSDGPPRDFTPSHILDGRGKFSAASEVKLTADIVIPVKLESSETLEYMGQR
ncbi:hypothetical protein TWF506_003211 [Arthrobotrys conoides]|uniref:Uncharacterized protein n=1 Tax=Arthrobotrys conoides TaxID=74498 RepID=A0AAN8RR18_9PEZI